MKLSPPHVIKFHVPQKRVDLRGTVCQVRLCKWTFR